MKTTRAWIIIVLMLVFPGSKASAYCIMGPIGGCPQSGTGWSGATATFHSKGFIGSNSAFDSAFADALNNWNNLSDFSYSSELGSVDPCDDPPNETRGWKIDSTVCSDAFGSTTLAVTRIWASSFNPSINNIIDSDITFNSDKTWDVFNGTDSLEIPGALDIGRVAVHELGHALGLDHEITIPDIIMDPFYSKTIETPQTDDINGLIALYGGVPCTFSITPANQSFNSSGSSGDVSVTATSGCNWTASSNASWLIIISGNSGTGDGTVNYSVSPHTDVTSRTGTITIAGETFTVKQEGINIPPFPDIKANSSDGPVTPTDNLLVTIALDSGSRLGDNADWWLAANVSGTTINDGWYYFDLSAFGFVFAGASPDNLLVTHQGPLFNLAMFQILNIPVSVLRPGTYTFYSAVDMNMNGVLDFVEQFVDFVDVTVTESAP